MAKRMAWRRQCLQEEIKHVSGIPFAFAAISSYTSTRNVVGLNMLTVKDANDMEEFHHAIERIHDTYLSFDRD